MDISAISKRLSNTKEAKHKAIPIKTERDALSVPQNFIESGYNSNTTKKVITPATKKIKSESDFESNQIRTKTVSNKNMIILLKFKEKTKIKTNFKNSELNQFVPAPNKA